jgi:uncharacterized membrane protein
LTPEDRLDHKAQATSRRWNWLRIAGLVCFGVLMAEMVARLTSPLVAAVCGWDSLAISYLAVLFWRLGRVDSKTLSRRAAEIDQGRRMLTGLFVAAAIASLGAIGVIVSSGHDAFRVALGGATILISWTLMHTVFATHYAHRYFAVGGGIDFPGDPAPRFSEFLYFAFTVGMTFQVSDVTTTSQSMRRLVLTHAVVAFAFNTVIIAITVGVAASLI